VTLELIYFWCWSSSRCGCGSCFSLSLTIADTIFNDILSLTRGRRCSGIITYGILTYIRSPQGDNATALAEFVHSEHSIVFLMCNLVSCHGCECCCLLTVERPMALCKHGQHWSSVDWFVTFLVCRFQHE